jgi:hypothetical protein
MRLNHITEIVINNFFAKLLCRAIGAAVLVLFTLIAAYYFTIAGTLVLEGLYGMLYARLIVAVIYVAAALLCSAMPWRVNPVTASISRIPIIVSNVAIFLLNESCGANAKRTLLVSYGKMVR